MILAEEQCYQALMSHDRRFDGRFFVGVSSTGIYCRPVCTARTPRRENCRFFFSAAAAEVAGYRPCLRCRPELAPGKSSVDATARLAYAAAALMNEGFLSGHSFDDLAAHLEISGRHLRRVFHEEFGVAPVEYLQTQRLLLAKQLLSDTRLPMIDVALASDFQSLRRFNALFKSRYGLAPSQLRAASLQKREVLDEEMVCFHLGYRLPFDWCGLLGFLSQRSIPGVEEVEGDTYRRTVSLPHNGKRIEGMVEVRPSVLPSKECLSVRMSSALLPVCALVLEKIKRLFDLAADPSEIQGVLGEVAAARPGLRVPGCFDGFEMAVRAILGQQISVRAARTLAGRLACRFGSAGKYGVTGLTTLFPEPSQIVQIPVEELAAIGLVRKRAEAIRALAEAIVAGHLALHPGELLHRTLGALKQVPGIGEWTREYIAMRALAWPDAFPHTDLGIKKALAETSSSKILKIAEKWRPWRAYAVMHLWRRLEENP